MKQRKFSGFGEMQDAAVASVVRYIERQGGFTPSAVLPILVEPHTYRVHLPTVKEIPVIPFAVKTEVESVAEMRVAMLDIARNGFNSIRAANTRRVRAAQESKARISAASAKRERKNNARRAVYFQQRRLNIFPTTR